MSGESPIANHESRTGAVRVRFSPSPTQDLALGGVRIALYNWLLARRERGTFVLRIENLDAPHDRGEAVMEALRWCGLAWDEGPHLESDRREIYEKYARELESRGRAVRIAGALHFRIDNEDVGWDDLIHGPSDRLMTEDVILVRADGRPSYNFTCVVDDHEMGITHVLRPDDFFTNTGVQIALYRALGWTPPRFGCVPPMVDGDGEKLSFARREKYESVGLPVSVNGARRLGYLPEAVLNFVALLGWDAPEEGMSLDEMAERFSLEHFDDEPERASVKFLRRLNAYHVQAVRPERLLDCARAFAPDATMEQLLRVRPRLRRLDELPGLLLRM